MTRLQSQNTFAMDNLFSRVRFQRGLIFGAMIIGALFAFELFNFSTTEFALGDLLGQSSFMGARWSTILALAFCGIDFAGIARLFTPEEGADEPAEVWYLFGAWLLAATMNAMLTWWGVSIAILDHQTLGNAVIDRSALLKVVPIFVAVLVWLSRVLIIGTFSVAGDRLFSQSKQRVTRSPNRRPGIANGAGLRRNRGTAASQASFSNGRKAPANPVFKPFPKGRSGDQDDSDIQVGYNRPEPTYHPVGMRPSSKKTGGYR